MKALNQISAGLLFMHGHFSAATVRALREEQEAVEKAKPIKTDKVEFPCCPPPLANCA